MKKLIVLLVLAVGAVTSMLAAVQEVVYLKNGSVIRGTIIEQVPNESLKIQTGDGSIFSYKMSEVEKITKEQSNSRSISFNSDGHGPEVGYRGFIDLGYTIGTGAAGAGRIEFNTVHGYQFLPYLYAGVGAGAHYYHEGKVVAIPIFADIRSDFLDNKISPFVDFRIGYSPYDIKGLYLNPSAGCRIGLNGQLAFNVSVGYSMQKQTVSEYRYSFSVNSGGFNIRLGLEF